jgi:hypothetical protein
MISRFGEVRGRLRAGTKPEPEKTCLEDGFWPRFALQKEAKMASKVVPERSRFSIQLEPVLRAVRGTFFAARRNARGPGRDKERGSRARKASGGNI